ncbi:hypothetical protein [uncultured Corynebacterium sp.]|uniref:hypothetical protein n=1 Tax=uncultured Corynebacterium sp. TaxID=159447 RepID=UPI0026038767|nr:hypothetical protein [uncultured Corynebacterium sp.]
MAAAKKRRRITKRSAHDYDRTADRPSAVPAEQPDRVVPLDDEQPYPDAETDGSFTEEYWREQMPPHYARRQ